MKDHFFLAIIYIAKQIIVLDSLSPGQAFKNFSLTFYALINIVKAIYCSNSITEFDLSKWEFILSFDRATQYDDWSCGHYAIANVASILSFFEQSNQIVNIDRFKVWVGRIVRKHRETDIYCNKVPKSIDKFESI